MRRAFAALLVGITLAGCGGPPPTGPAYDVVAEALKAFDRSDWGSAARLLREAIVKQPADVRLHYSLGVAATHLELREEAIREFQWVLANAPAGSPEAIAARNWLIAAGVLSTPSMARDAGPSTDGGGADAETGDGAVHGQVSWPDGEAPVKIARLQLFLKGVLGTPNQDFQRVVRADEQGRFRFTRIPAGTYRLMDRIAGEPHWRLRVTVAPSQDVAIELTPDNSVRVRDDFPQSGG